MYTLVGIYTEMYLWKRYPKVRPRVYWTLDLGREGPLSGSLPNPPRDSWILVPKIRSSLTLNIAELRPYMA